MTSTHIARRWLSAVALAALMLALLTPNVFAQTKTLVYLNGDITTPNQNAVYGFVNDGLGNLTPVAGSPFLTGGTGVGSSGMGDAQWDSDQEVVINSAGTVLFAVNGHSNNISAFTIGAAGVLHTVSGSPFPSGGPQPASIGLKNNAYGNDVSLMFVVNKNSDPLQTGGFPNYTTFRVSPGGVMVPNAGSTWPLAAGVSPAQAVVRRDAVQFFGIEFMNSTVTAYQASHAGVLSQISQSIPPVDNPPVLGAVLHPRVRALYVALPVQHAIAVYSYDAAGNLTFVRTVPNLGLAVCWLAVNDAGTRLYAAETPSSSITVYDITHPGTPQQLQEYTLPEAGALPTHMRLDPSQQFLYVLDRTGVLHVLDLDGNGLMSENRSPINLGLPTGTVPLGLAVK
jgi:hypothetical protein